MNKVNLIVGEDIKVMEVTERFMNPENIKTEQSESSGDMPVENTVMV